MSDAGSWGERERAVWCRLRKKETRRETYQGLLVDAPGTGYYLLLAPTVGTIVSQYIPSSL